MNKCLMLMMKYFMIFTVMIFSLQSIAFLMNGLGVINNHATLTILICCTSLFIIMSCFLVVWSFVEEKIFKKKFEKFFGNK